MSAVLSQALHTSVLMSPDEYIQPRRPVLAHVQAAGDATRANVDCTASCLSFDERPQTPDHQKKYRQSVLHEPGKIVRHFGVAEDPIHEGSFGRGTIARPGESVADYIKSYPQSRLAQWALQRSEDVYARWLAQRVCSTGAMLAFASCRGSQLHLFYFPWLAAAQSGSR